MSVTPAQIKALTEALAAIVPAAPARPPGVDLGVLRVAINRLVRAERAVNRQRHVMDQALDDLHAAQQILFDLHNLLDPRHLRGSDATAKTTTMHGRPVRKPSRAKRDG